MLQPLTAKQRQQQQQQKADIQPAVSGDAEKQIQPYITLQHDTTVSQMSQFDNQWNDAHDMVWSTYLVRKKERLGTCPG